ncbi:50S ribosomal protein L14e [Candidatus Woesearchaeota archaeon]|nr:MAG: 50S ribosomal protein L14e [Candidatus Woesearchaeota archaeon]
MIEIGRICMKIAGRDAGKICIVTDEIDKTYVLIDGQTRRRKCNRAHLEPLNQKVKIEKGASNELVRKELEKLGYALPKPKVKKSKPKTSKKTSE